MHSNLELTFDKYYLKDHLYFLNMGQQYKFSMLFLGLILFLISCGPAAYRGKSNFETTIIKGRKTLAVLPFNIVTESKPIDGIASQSQEYSNRQLGYTTQKNVYLSCLDQFGKKKYNVSFQDILYTGEILRKNHIQYEDIPLQDKAELCNMLGVDGVIIGDIHSATPLLDESETKPDNQRRPIPNKTNASLKIYDQRDVQLVWDYNYATPNVIGNNVQSITKAIMENISLKFPYKKK